MQYNIKYNEIQCEEKCEIHGRDSFIFPNTESVFRQYLLYNVIFDEFLKKTHYTRRHNVKLFYAKKYYKSKQT